MLWQVHWYLYEMLLILLRNSIFSSENIFSVYLIFWYHFVKQTIFQENKFWVWKVQYQKLVSDICPTRFTSHQTSWQSGKWYLFSGLYRNVVFFLISSTVLGLLDQLNIFLQLYLIELLGLLTGWGYSSCGTWYIQNFWQGLTCWSSSQLYFLWNFRSDIWPYFFFSQ